TGQGVLAASQTLGVVVPYSPEYRGIAADTDLLPRLSSLTGGRVLTLSQTNSVFEHNLSAAKSSTPTWPLLLLLAILLLPFDIGVRRVSIYRGDVTRAIESARRRLGLLPKPAPAMPGASTPEIAALFGAKRRTTARAEMLKPITGDKAATDLQTP